MQLAQLPALLIFCGMGSVLCGACMGSRLWPIPLLLGIGLLAWSYLAGTLLPGLEAVLYAISARYNNAYGWGTIRWSETVPAYANIAPVLCAIAGPILVTVSRTVSRRKSAVPAVLISLLPLMSCLVITDVLPEMKWLYLLIAGIVLLVLTNLLRRQDLRRGNRLTAILAVPVALAAIRLRASTSAVSEVAEVDSPASSKISLAAAVPAAARAVLVSGASEAELELVALAALAVSVEPMPVMAQVLTSVLAVATAAAAVSKVLEPTMAK